MPTKMLILYIVLIGFNSANMINEGGFIDERGLSALLRTRDTSNWSRSETFIRVEKYSKGCSPKVLPPSARV